MGEKKAKKPSKIKKIQSAGMMRKIMADYFYEMNDAAKAGSPLPTPSGIPPISVHTLRVISAHI